MSVCLSVLSLCSLSDTHAHTHTNTHTLHTTDPGVVSLSVCLCLSHTSTPHTHPGSVWYSKSTPGSQCVCVCVCVCLSVCLSVSHAHHTQTHPSRPMAALTDSCSWILFVTCSAHGFLLFFFLRKKTYLYENLWGVRKTFQHSPTFKSRIGL